MQIVEAVVDEYLFHTGEDRERVLPTFKKYEITKRRMEELDKTEWQRWVPLVGLARFFRDTINGDSILLRESRSTKYNLANISYNCATGIAAGAGILHLMMK